jgi:hypothetical protein
MVGRLKAPDALRNGTGEGAFLMAEELALEQAFRNRRTIHADEWAAAPSAELVNQPGEHFFARTGLATDNDGGIRRGNYARLPQGTLKSLARSHDPICVFAAIGSTLGCSL